LKHLVYLTVRIQTLKEAIGVSDLGELSASSGLHRLNRFGIGNQWFKGQCLDLHAELRDMVKKLERPAPEGSS